MAWNENETLRFADNTAKRVPACNSGVTVRGDLLGAYVLEAYWAHP